jgi:O-antigen/teichoic acid export membrane protein
MIAAAPILVARLGLEQYGVWMLVMALAGGLGVFGFGFSEATVRYVSKFRGLGDDRTAETVIQVSLAATMLLSLLPSVGLVLAASWLAEQAFRIPGDLQAVAIRAIRAGGALLLVRCVELVLVSALRGSERYALAVRTSLAVKVSTVGVALFLAVAGKSVALIVMASVVIASVGVFFQALSVRRVIPGVLVVPKFDRTVWSEIKSFGMYSWLQSLGSTLFSHADRLVVGAVLGVKPVAYYTLCVQLVQPIHGLASAAFNFLFPRMTALMGEKDTLRRQKAFRLALITNLALVGLLSVPLLVVGRPLLRMWMGAEFASQATGVLNLLVLAFAILSINVVPHYALMAAGKARFLAIVNALGGILSIAGALFLMPVFGISGAALSRSLHGLIVSLNFAEVRKTI